MAFGEDNIVNGDHQCSDQGYADFRAHFLSNIAQKPPVKGESVVLSSDLLRMFKALLFEVEE